VAQPQVSKRLRGQIPWSVPELELVADLFGMDVVELVQRAANNDAPHQASMFRAWSTWLLGRAETVVQV
jgi:hypothetical protein